MPRTEIFTLNKQQPRLGDRAEVLRKRTARKELLKLGQGIQWQRRELPRNVVSVCINCGHWYQSIPKAVIKQQASRGFLVPRNTLPVCMKCEGNGLLYMPPELRPWQLIAPDDPFQGGYATNIYNFTCLGGCGRAFCNWALFGCTCKRRITGMKTMHGPRAVCRWCCAAGYPEGYGMNTWPYSTEKAQPAQPVQPLSEASVVAIADEVMDAIRAEAELAGRLTAEQRMHDRSVRRRSAAPQRSWEYRNSVFDNSFHIEDARNDATDDSVYYPPPPPPIGRRRS